MIEQDSYYRCQYADITVDGQPLTWATRAALGPPGDRLTSAMLLAESARAAPGACVLHLHCAEGIAGVAIARQLGGGSLTLLDANAAAVDAARCTLAANGIEGPQVTLSDCASAVCDQRYDLVLSLLPKGRAVWEQTVLDAAAVLRPGGDLILAGANDAGIKSAAKFVERVFGQAIVLAYRGGCRAIRAARPAILDLPQSTYYDWRMQEQRVGETRLTCATRPGLFSWQRLDDGTRLLIEALYAHPLDPDDRVLDLGSGCGILSLVAARQATRGNIVAVDADCRAVEATRRTLAYNHVAHAQALISDCAWAVRDQAFTAVVTNPPFHRQRDTTYAVVEQMIRDAARLLLPGGRLYLVANRFLRYGPLIEEAFGSANALSQTNRFTVWYASKER
jgi:16S rRNA (guanine1207-N2)-methyltransferase